MQQLSQPKLPNIIDECSVNRGCISRILTSTSMNFEVDEDDVFYVMENLEFPTWLSIDRDRKLIVLQTYIDAEVDNESALLDAINGLNSQYIIVQFHLRDQRLFGFQWLPFEGGLNPVHLLGMLRLFSSVFAEAARAILDSNQRITH